MRRRRAGQNEAPPVARPPLEVSCRSIAAPGRIAGIRGLARVLEKDRREAEAAWRAVWAAEGSAA